MNNQLEYKEQWDLIPYERKLKLKRRLEEPITQDEKDWFEFLKFNEQENAKRKEKEKQEELDYEKREEEAIKEAIEIFNKYAPKEYLDGGRFNNKKFFYKYRNANMEAIKFYYYSMGQKIVSPLQKMINPGSVSQNLEKLIILKSTKEYLSFKYNIDDWMPCEYLIDKKYFDEIKQIEEKYNVKLFYFHDFSFLYIERLKEKYSWQEEYFMAYLAFRLERMKEVDGTEFDLNYDKLYEFLDEFSPI